jgi:hypothetical protein
MFTRTRKHKFFLRDLCVFAISASKEVADFTVG